MADAATSRYLARKQSLGSNTNTWGDTKLNDDLDLFDRGSKGYQATTITADTTLTWTNYSTSNVGQVAIWKLNGSLTSTTNITVPSVEWVWNIIWNNTGANIVVKTSGGTGVTIPTGRKVGVFCDGSDCYFAIPNYIGDDFTESNSRDIMDKAAVETAIATANLPATAGTVLNSATDPGANYLANKLALSTSGAISGSLATTDAGTASEKSTFALAVSALGLTRTSVQSAGFTPATGNIYPTDCSSNTVTLTGSSTPTVGDIFGIEKYGTFGVNFNPNSLKINGVVQTLSTQDEGICAFRYVSTARGWIKL